jgi:hypothetical protein
MLPRARAKTCPASGNVYVLVALALAKWIPSQHGDTVPRHQSSKELIGLGRFAGSAMTAREDNCWRISIWSLRPVKVGRDVKVRTALKHDPFDPVVSGVDGSDLLCV